MATLESVRARIARCQNDYRERSVFVCFFGDSNTVGWGHESIQHREAYPTRLLAALHDRFPRCLFNGVNAGIAGDTMVQAVERIDDDVLRYRPDLTIIALGLNDAALGRAQLAPYAAALEAGVTRIMACSAVVVLTPCMQATRISPAVPQLHQDVAAAYVATQLDGTLDEFVDIMRATAQRHGAPLADAYALWKAYAAAGVDTTAWLINGLNHPAGHAHRIYLDALLACLEREQLFTLL